MIPSAMARSAMSGNIKAASGPGLKGPASVSQGGIYGLTPGPIIYPYVGNGPGSRFAPGYWYVYHGPPNYDEFWMFGGEGFDTAGTNGNDLLSDLWRYLPYP